MRKYRSMHCWRYLDILHLRILLWSLHNDRFGCGNFNLLCGALAQLSILDMVRTTKDSIHLFKADILCLCDEEPYVRKQYHIDGTEHVHGVEAFHIQTVATHDGLKKNAKRNMRKTVAMPTLRVLPSLRLPGVSVTTAAAINMHIAIPTAPARNKNRRPNLSTVQVALRVKMMPKVPFNALISWIVSLSVNTDWYILVE